MTEIWINQFLTFTLALYAAECGALIALMRWFKIKVTRKSAYIWTFIIALYSPVTSSLTLMLSPDLISDDTIMYQLIMKGIVLLGELLIILYIRSILVIQYSKVYWLYLIMRMIVLSIPMILFSTYFMRIDEQNIGRLITVTYESLPKYLLVLLTVLACSILIMLTDRFLKLEDKIKKVPKQALYVIYSIYVIYFILFKRNYSNDSSEIETSPAVSSDMVFIIIVIFIIVILVAISFIEHYDKKQLILEKSLLTEKNELQYASYQFMQQKEEETHKLYHDIGNHIRTLQVLLASGETEKVRQYTNTLADQYEKIRERYYCNNAIINAVLQHKLEVCDQHNIKHDLELNIPDDLPFRDMDLMSIYSNLLDNAIEECIRNEGADNYIHIKSSMVGDYFSVMVINNKKIEASKDSSHGITRKKEGNLHGYGLKILDEIAERYQGFKEITDSGTEFTSMIMLNKGVA